MTFEWERGAAETYSQAGPARVPDWSPTEPPGSIPGTRSGDLLICPATRDGVRSKAGNWVAPARYGESFSSRERACWSTQRVRRGWDVAPITPIVRGPPPGATRGGTLGVGTRDPRKAVGLHAPPTVSKMGMDPAHQMSIPVPEVYAGSPAVPETLPVWGDMPVWHSRHGEWDKTK